jgi:RNA polymerase sigma factor (sigma-70 family)
MEKTDEELILEYIAGDESAFKSLITRYSKPLYFFIFRMTNKADMSEDVLQDVCIKIWKNISKYKIGSGTFKSLAFTIARNTTIDHLRKKKMLVVSDFDTVDGKNYLMDTVSDPETIPEVLIEKAEQKNTITKIMENLSIEEREILTLHYQEEMTFEEIGKIMEKSLNTVKSKHRRAVFKLKNYLEKSNN